MTIWLFTTHTSMKMDTGWQDTARPMRKYIFSKRLENLNFHI